MLPEIEFLTRNRGLFAEPRAITLDSSLKSLKYQRHSTTTPANSEPVWPSGKALGW